VRYDAGLFAACLGLAALSVRGGSMRGVLQAADGAGIYGLLITESVLLWLIVACGAGVLDGMARLGVVQRGQSPSSPPRGSRTPVVYGMAVIALHAATMALVLYILALSDAKAQVLVSSFVAGMAGAALIGGPLHESGGTFRLLVAPLVVAVAGYLLGWMDAGQIVIGYTAQPLARPLPLDLVGAGCAGSVFGGWLGSKYNVKAMEPILAVFLPDSPAGESTDRAQSK
jgi:hypothetical protein